MANDNGSVRQPVGTFCGFELNVSENPTVYALCKSDLQAAVDAECSKGRFYLFDEDMNRVPVSSYTVNKEQECYYIVFNADYKGVPIFNEMLYYLMIKDLAVAHPSITAIYSADGLMELQINDYRSNFTQGEKVTKLITPEAAAKSINEKYKDVGICLSAFITDKYVASFSPYIIWYTSRGILSGIFKTETVFKGNYNLGGVGISILFAAVYFGAVIIILGIIFCKKAVKRCER